MAHPATGGTIDPKPVDPHWHADTGRTAGGDVTGEAGRIAASRVPPRISRRGCPGESQSLSEKLSRHFIGL